MKMNLDRPYCQNENNRTCFLITKKGEGSTLIKRGNILKLFNNALGCWWRFKFDEFYVLQLYCVDHRIKLQFQ